MISVIVPVYNVEPYIRQFIESVQGQSYADFELLLVDDCSTDKSMEIAMEYTKRDSRIRLLRQPVNGGCAQARNRGLSEAEGEYIMFADSDDYLSADALETLYTILVKKRADIVYGGFYNTYEATGELKRKKFRFARGTYDKRSAVISHLNLRTLYGYPWGKLFKREVLHGVENPEDMNSGEDGVFSFRALWNAEKIVFTDQPVYYYRIRQDSLTNRTNQFTEKNLQCMKQYQYVRECIGGEKKYADALRVFEFCMYRGSVEKYQRSSEEIKKKYEEEYRFMKSACDKNWKKVALYSINPRITLEALRYGLRGGYSSKEMIDAIRSHADLPAPFSLSHNMPLPYCVTVAYRMAVA